MEIVASVSKTVRPKSAPWRLAMQSAVRDPVRLCQLLELPESLGIAAQQAAAEFPLFAPLPFISRMRIGDPHDPLLRQVLPLAAELEAAEGFTKDPLAETAAGGGAGAVPGFLQKYQARGLMVATATCAVHCRYCFRRHFPYQEEGLSPSRWGAAVAAIAADESIEEAILSGGDPLTASDESLAELVQSLAQIPHLRRLRVHSRLPIVIPERVAPPLIDWLTNTRLAPYFVIHANHPQEIDASVAASLKMLVEAGIPVLNQAVLLRGVNDSVEALAELSLRLLDLRVLPYYLHQLDRVAGAAHFEVPISRGRELIAALHARLPGYGVPKYVQEIPGESGKRAL